MPTSVLVIDDDKATRDMLSILLHDEGGCAVIAASALDIQHATPHRLVILFDHHMYHMSSANGVALLVLAEQKAGGVTQGAPRLCVHDRPQPRVPTTQLVIAARILCGANRRLAPPAGGSAFLPAMNGRGFLRRSL
jgi:CheY-like chemotaxis protein